MGKKLVEKIREIETEIVMIALNEELSFQERMEKTWELQGRLRLAHARLVEEVEAAS